MRWLLLIILIIVIILFIRLLPGNPISQVLNEKPVSDHVTPTDGPTPTLPPLVDLHPEGIATAAAQMSCQALNDLVKQICK